VTGGGEWEGSHNYFLEGISFQTGAEAKFPQLRHAIKTEGAQAPQSGERLIFIGEV
jgi:hypothetical protein